MGETKLRVAVFCEGELQTVVGVANDAEARAIGRGVVIGAIAYGGGSVAVYRLPDDEAAMREEQDKDLADRAVATEAP